MSALRAIYPDSPPPTRLVYEWSEAQLERLAIKAAELVDARRARLSVFDGIVPPDGLNQTHLAKLLGCSTEHVRALEKRGVINGMRDGGAVMYSAETIAGLFRARMGGDA